MRLGEVSESEVRCLLCKRVFKSLNGHLKKAHNLTAEEYRGMFPGVLVSSSSTTERRSEVFSGAMLAFLQTEEGEEWCRQQSEDAKVFASEHPELYKKSPEHRRKIGDKVHAFHVEHPDAASEKMTPEVKKQISGTVTEHHSDPEYRRETSEHMLKYCAEHPDLRKKKPGQVEKHKASLARYLESPEGLEQRQKHSEMMSELGKQRYLEDPESFQSFIDAGQQNVKWRDTKPELAMAAILDALGLTYDPQGRIPELNKPHRYHKWDFTLRAERIVIEVDGCYWHGCPEHYAERLQEDVIKEQIARENQRDLEADLSGWTVLRLWEHELAERSGEIAMCVIRAMCHQWRMSA